ncbi:hypothetical protein [Paraburkholderia silvatlantica]|uniref:hypothetical protein n=1 Tax=Paraburkholderia silvatlantica TaxID=321895 RepID=UPI003752728C
MKLFTHKAMFGASERLGCQKIGQEAFPKKLLQKKRDPAPAISLECAVTFREWRLNGACIRAWRAVVRAARPDGGVAGRAASPGLSR